MPLNLDNLIKVYGNKLEIKAHLKCYLKTRPWRGGDWETTVSAEDDVNITLNLTPVSEPGRAPSISFTVCGRRKEPNNEVENIGNNYKTIALIINHSKNTLKHSDFTIYEDGESELSFSLGANGLKSGQSKVFMHWFNENWTWYKTKSDGEKLKVIDKANRKHRYKLAYYLRDEYGWEYKDTVDRPEDEQTILVIVPAWKLAALDVYNESFDAEDTNDLTVLIAGALLTIGGAYIGWDIGKGIGAIIGGLLGLGGGSGGDYGSDYFQDIVREVRREMKELVDDPPTFDKNYKKLVRCKVKKVRLRKPKNKHENLLFEMAELKESLIANSKAMRKTVSRVWTAEQKEDKPILKKQDMAFKKYRGTLRRNLKSLSNRYAKVSDEFKKSKLELKREDAIVFRNKIAKSGIPKEIKRVLKKQGISRKRVRGLENRLKTLNLNNLNPAETYLRFSRALLKLRNALKDTEL